MLIEFLKYHGAGNDFILIDNRTEQYNNLSEEDINKLCDRNFGIGADGLMLLGESENHDFTMKYFNSDGKESTMCGNGGRCIVLFAHHLGIIKESTIFTAIDGVHEAKLISPEIISIKMSDVSNIRKKGDVFVIDTGSPHHVEFRSNISEIDVLFEARKIRYNNEYSKDGINVNFVEIKDNHIFSRTYERGVENETLACGTGAVAIAIAHHVKNEEIKNGKYDINALGGKLMVAFETLNNNVFTNIILTGPVKKVFQGSINL